VGWTTKLVGLCEYQKDTLVIIDGAKGGDGWKSGSESDIYKADPLSRMFRT